MSAALRWASWAVPGDEPSFPHVLGDKVVLGVYQFVGETKGKAKGKHYVDAF